MREAPSPTGCLHVVLYDPRDGRVVDDRRVRNLVTTGGRDLLAHLLGGLEQVVEIRLAVGGAKDVETSAAAFEDDALERPVREVKATFERGEPTKERSVSTVSATLPVGGDALTLREAGLVVKVKALSGGAERDVLYNRVVFETITKEPNLAMTLTWELMF